MAISVMQIDVVLLIKIVIIKKKTLQPVRIGFNNPTY